MGPYVPDLWHYFQACQCCKQDHPLLARLPIRLWSQLLSPRPFSRERAVFWSQFQLILFSESQLRGAPLSSFNLQVRNNIPFSEFWRAWILCKKGCSEQNQIWAKEGGNCVEQRRRQGKRSQFRIEQVLAEKIQGDEVPFWFLPWKLSWETPAMFAFKLC